MSDWRPICRDTINRSLEGPVNAGDTMKVEDKQPAKTAKRSDGKSFKPLLLVAAAPIVIILFWISFVTLLPLFLK